MKENVSRREFLKTTSISAAGVTALSLKPLSAAFGPLQEKSRIIVAKDEESFDLSNGSVDSERVQDMVDYAIIWLMKAPSKAEAYEALFPAGELSTTTKIFVQYNETKRKKSITQSAVLDALKNGLTSMLDGSFPESNITFKGHTTDSGAGDSFDIGNSSFQVTKSWQDDCDFFINCPSCWAINNCECGVTMALKGTMPTVKDPSSNHLGAMHPNFKSSSDPALSILNSQDVLKNKQVLVLLDAICLGAGRANEEADNAAHSIIASKDIVAVDYLGVDILDKTGDFSLGDKTNKEDALTVINLAADPKWELGTNDPDNMEKEEITTPWTNPFVTGLKTTGDTGLSLNDIQVVANPTHTIFKYPGITGNQSSISIFDAQGRKIWEHMSSESSVVWNNNDMQGQKVSKGTYVFRLQIGKAATQGKISVK